MTMVATYEMAKNGEFVKDGIKHFDDYSQFDGDVWFMNVVEDCIGDDMELVKRSTRIDTIDYSEDPFGATQELNAIWELRNGDKYEIKVHATIREFEES